MTSKEFYEICDFLGETPSSIEMVIKSLSESEVRHKPDEQDFSVLEHICHMRDIEGEGYRPRIQRLLAEDNPFLPDIDGDRLALERGYNSQEIASAFEEFSRFRAENLRVLRSVPLDKLESVGILENVGAISLAKLILMMLEHDDEHLQTINKWIADRQENTV
jgi:hypothetical protein